VRVAKDEAERQLLWKGRKSAFGAYGAFSPPTCDDGVTGTQLPYFSAA